MDVWGRDRRSYRAGDTATLSERLRARKREIIATLLAADPGIVSDRALYTKVGYPTGEAKGIFPEIPLPVRVINV